MMIRCALPALLLLLSAMPALAQVELKHKYQEGSSFSNEVIGTITQTLTIAGMDVETKVENIVTSKYVVEKANADGLIPVKSKVESIQMTVTAQGSEYSFDSANPDKTGNSPLEMLRDVHKAMIDSETELLIGKDGRVAEIKTPDLGLDSVPEQVRQLASSQLQPEYLMQAANQVIDQIPTEAVKKGQTWDREETVDFGGGQLMTFKKRYTYEGTADENGKQLHKITSKVLEVDFEFSMDSPLPIKLKESKLKAEDSSGEILFNQEMGQIVKSKGSIQIKGDLTFEASGQELPASLDLKMNAETTIR